MQINQGNPHLSHLSKYLKYCCYVGLVDCMSFFYENFLLFSFSIACRKGHALKGSGENSTKRCKITKVIYDCSIKLVLAPIKDFHFQLICQLFFSMNHLVCQKIVNYHNFFRPICQTLIITKSSCKSY